MNDNLKEFADRIMGSITGGLYMEHQLELPDNYKQTYGKIVKMIEAAKYKVYETANYETVYLFWHVGQELKDSILQGQKADYGKSVVKNMSKELEIKYGHSYDKSALFRMIQFYESFSDYTIRAKTGIKVATRSNFLRCLGGGEYGSF